MTFQDILSQFFDVIQSAVVLQKKVCHADYLYVLHSSLIIILLTCRISVVRLYFQSEWKIVWILIRWLHQNPADLDLECFQNRINWALTRESLSSGVCDNKGPDQPAHPRRLISAFVIRFLESIISKLTTSKIAIF